MKNKRTLFIISEDWALVSHRLHLVDAAIAKGFVVGIATRITKYREMLEKRGVKVFEWQLERKSLNPVTEILAILNLCKVLWSFRPDIIHAVAQKPVIYAGVAKKFYYKVGFVATLGGMGFIFTAKNFKAKILRPIVKSFLKFALVGKNTRLIMQNKDNIKTIINLNIIKTDCVRLVKGAGVEIEKFLPTPVLSNYPMVILPTRMLWDKGVYEFVTIASRIKAKGIKALFVLVGDIDLHNPASLSQNQIDKWVASGVVEQWSRRDDMEIIYPKASVICFPSYNEGLPKVLLEAGSCSRPSVAFDVPGCREVIKNGVNGFLLEFGNLCMMEAAITELIKDKKLCNKIGRNARTIVETEFSSIIINTKTFDIWDEVIC